MLISKFHKIIANKWVWTVLAVLISVAFVGLFTPGINNSRTEQTMAAGKLYGEDISRQEYNIASYFEKGLVNDKVLEDNELAEINKKTWQRIAALKTASRMGISVTDQEVLNAITSDRTFANQAGQFDKRIFKAVLNQIRLDESIYLEYVKQQLTLYKIQKHLETEVWIPEQVIDTKLSDLTDVVTVKAGFINNQEFTNEVSVTDELIQEYYNENKELFEIPENISVKYIRWPTIDLISKIDISQEQIASYYTNYIDEFSVADTNNNLVPIPLEEVSEQIAKTLKTKEAQDQLYETASDFIRNLEPKDGKSVVFEEIVAAAGLQVTTTGLFTAEATSIDDIQGIQENDIKSLFSLQKDDPWRCFSDPVISDDAIYVFVANSRIPPRIPALEEIKETIKFYVKQEELSRVSKEKAETLIDKIQNDVADGKSFEEAAKALKIETIDAGSFMPYVGITNDIPYAQVIAQSIIGVKQGEASAPVSLPTSTMFSFVEKRESGEPIEQEMIRPQMISSITRYRAELTFPKWCDEILNSKEADFQNFLDEPINEKEKIEKEIEIDEEAGV